MYLFNHYDRTEDKSDTDDKLEYQEELLEIILSVPFLRPLDCSVQRLAAEILDRE